MNKQAVRLNINAEELALCKPESVQAMDLAIRKVLSEIDQAKTAKDQAQKSAECPLKNVGPNGRAAIAMCVRLGVAPNSPECVIAMIAAASADMAIGQHPSQRKPEACALATEDEDEDEQPAGETFRF